MKVCLLCGETYNDPIDFCFRDGEVLASGASREVPARSEAYTTTPGHALAAAAAAAADEPEVTRANRRALMRAAAAAYVVTDVSTDTDPNHARESGAPVNGASTSPALIVSPLDQGMSELPWPPEDEVPEEPEPPRGSMFAAALIGALVVVAAALGAGLLVLVGLGQRETAPADPPPTSGRPTISERGIVLPPHERAPLPRPTVDEAPSGDAGNPDQPVKASDAGPIASGVAASDFRVVLGDAGGPGSTPLVLYVDGTRAGVVPVTVRLTPGEHTFRVATETSGTAMLEVRRTVESPSDPADIPTIDLTE